MKYIVRNCPAILPMTKLCDSENLERPGDYCLNCTDCVIKQVIEKCNQAPILDADWVLKLFDIEEIRK